MVELNLEVPPDFYEEEVRNGFVVSTQMKQLWAVELDLLVQFQKVCQNYNLRYFALGGTLLGAIRHKGFIPWDDDIDVIMPRKDYDKLLSVASTEFHYPYFLSYTLTECNYWKRHAVLRNSLTTGFTKYDINKNNNKGIYIDIMPMDNVPPSIEERNIHRKKIKSITKWIDIKNGSQGAIKYNFSIINMLKFLLSSIMVHTRNYDSIYYQFDAELKKYDGQTDYYGHASMSYRERGIWPVEWFENSLLCDFEFIKVSVPIEYQKVLEKYFGKDYMEIPKKILATDHGGITLNVDEPFTNSYRWDVRRDDN